MTQDVCTACSELKNRGSNVEKLGITDSMCESLYVDKGLNGKVNNCEDLHDISDCGFGLIQDKLDVGAYDPCDYQQAFCDLLSTAKTMSDSLICSDCGQWNSIHNLEKLIELIMGGNYKTLVEGQDYVLKWYNGFVLSGSNAVVVRISETETLGNLVIDIAHVSNPSLYPLELSHGGETNTTNTPLSWILGIKFIGDYAYLNNVITTEHEGENVFNCSPSSLRASWNMKFSYAQNLDNNKYVIAMSTLADGYNTDYKVYGDNTINLTPSGFKNVFSYKKV